MEQETIVEPVVETTKETVIDFGNLFEGSEISPEVQDKVKLIFESALAVKLEEEVAVIKADFETKFESTLDEVKAELVDKIDSFLDYAVEEWVDQNRVALETSIRNEITENFILGLKELFAENFIEVPEEKFDVLGEMETKVVDLSKDLDEEIAKNVELHGKINDMIKEAVVVEVSTGLTGIDADKFGKLIESVEFDSESSFKEKLVTIKENYFSKSSPKIEEKVEHPTIKKYLAGWK